MKRLVLLPLLAFPLLLPLHAASAPPAAQAAAPAAAPDAAAALTGTVLEVKDVPQYTYLRLRTRDGEIWAAVPTAQVKTGSEVAIVNYQVMNGFQSRSLNRTFDRIVFGTLAGKGTPSATPAAGAPHAGMAKSPTVEPVKVEKAKGAGAQTVAGIVSGRSALKDKAVVVRGQVVKFTPAVMGKNWIHLRDGTGSAADGSDDVLVVTTDSAKPGDIVLVKGTVRTDREIGSGYSYKVLVEDARLQR